MDGQLTFKALTDEATGATVRQINVTNLKDALKLMDASPDKWEKSLEAFVDAWLTKASQLDNVCLTPLPDKKKTLFIEAVKHHPVAIAAIQQQEGIEKVMKRQFLNQVFNHTLDNLINDIRMTCQQFDNLQGHKALAAKQHPKETLCANVAQTEAEKSTRYEKYKELMNAAGLWINPEVYANWMPEKKKAHTEKARGKRLAKKGKAKLVADTVSVVPSPLVAPPAAPPTPTYAQMASPPTMFTMMGRHYKLAVVMHTYKANATPNTKAV
jgi:hypothetical protein